MPKTITRTKSHQDEMVDAVVPAVDTTESRELVAITDELLDEIDRLLTTAKIEQLADALDATDKTTYTLADAIREGSTMTQQAIGGFTYDDGEKTCALSAAMLAIRARGLA